MDRDTVLMRLTSAVLIRIGCRVNHSVLIKAPFMRLRMSLLDASSTAS